jgi:hypothetical protein
MLNVYRLFQFTVFIFRCEQMLMALYMKVPCRDARCASLRSCVSAVCVFCRDAHRASLRCIFMFRCESGLMALYMKVSAKNRPPPYFSHSPAASRLITGMCVKLRRNILLLFYLQNACFAHNGGRNPWKSGINTEFGAGFRPPCGLSDSFRFAAFIFGNRLKVYPKTCLSVF